MVIHLFISDMCNCTQLNIDTALGSRFRCGLLQTNSKQKHTMAYVIIDRNSTITNIVGVAFFFCSFSLTNIVTVGLSSLAGQLISLKINKQNKILHTHVTSLNWWFPF